MCKNFTLALLVVRITEHFVSDSVYLILFRSHFIPLIFHSFSFQFHSTTHCVLYLCQFKTHKTENNNEICIFFFFLFLRQVAPGQRQTNNKNAYIICIVQWRCRKQKMFYVFLNFRCCRGRKNERVRSNATIM